MSDTIGFLLDLIAVIALSLAAIGLLIMAGAVLASLGAAALDQLDKMLDVRKRRRR